MTGVSEGTTPDDPPPGEGDDKAAGGQGDPQGAGPSPVDHEGIEQDDIAGDLGDRVSVQQRAVLHQLMVDAARLVKGGGVAVADVAVQNSGVNVHLGDVIIERRSVTTGTVLATGSIDMAILEAASRTFVKPSCFDALHSLVDGDRVAVVVAPRGSGVTTLALQLLGGISTSVRKLDPDHDVRRLDLTKLTKDTGYLMEAPPLDLLLQWRRRGDIRRLMAWGCLMHHS